MDSLLKEDIQVKKLAIGIIENRQERQKGIPANDLPRWFARSGRANGRGVSPIRD
jgi:hypothetical protein